MAHRKVTPKPLDLLFMLFDCCMARLSSNAFKVVCYVAAQHLRAHPEFLLKTRNPLMHAFQLDMEKLGRVEAPKEATDHPYRTDPHAPTIPGESVRRFAVISLGGLCSGVRTKRRWRDYGTGLSKSSAAAAIHEALASGVLVRQRNRNWAGRDLPSLYAINWDVVQQYEAERQKGRSLKTRMRAPKSATCLGTARKQQP
jgi:hypothetical protein